MDSSLLTLLLSALALLISSFHCAGLVRDRRFSAMAVFDPTLDGVPATDDVRQDVSANGVELAQEQQTPLPEVPSVAAD